MPFISVTTEFPHKTREGLRHITKHVDLSFTPLQAVPRHHCTSTAIGYQNCVFSLEQVEPWTVLVWYRMASPPPLDLAYQSTGVGRRIPPIPIVELKEIGQLFEILPPEREHVVVGVHRTEL